MQKIRTLFKRDPDHPARVIDEIDGENLFLGNTETTIVATEKLDGTNVRVTVRNGRPVRLEKRRNPTREQKDLGIVEPWYRDASVRFDQDGHGVVYDSADQHIARAVNLTSFADMPDGEWSGEAVGPNIQGNPLEIEVPHVVLFSVPEMREHLVFPTQPPTDFTLLRHWLGRAESVASPGHPPEGVVWWFCHRNGDVPVYKIKRKDFGL